MTSANLCTGYQNKDCTKRYMRNLHVLWFKFSILFPIVPDYANEYMTKEKKNWTSFKNFAPKLNLNQNTYMKLHAPMLPKSAKKYGK